MGSAVPTDEEIILSLGEDLPVGLWVARAPGGELVYANRTFAQIMGMAARDDVRAGGYSEPYGIFTRDGERYPENKLPFVRALEEKRVVVVDDIAIHRGDGTRVAVRAFARPVGDPITHIIVAFFDVTREVEAVRSRAEAERQLHRTQRLEAIGNLAGGIAHDFNNLVFSIKLVAAELAAGEEDPKRQASLQLIDDITNRSAALTRSLLRFAGHGRQRAVPISLNHLVASMKELLSRTLAGIDLEYALEASDGGTVIGDPSQLEQVVMNLVVNARDAVGGTGRLEIRTSDGGDSDGPQVVLEVCDDGPGIPDELRDRVFEPYFTTKTMGPVQGTGLGLATVFGIVESHGGTIEIGSGLGGAGTTMRVSLPVSSRPAAPASAAGAETVTAGQGVVLVVDDDATVRNALAVTINLLGYETLTAASGSEAIEIFERQHQALYGVVLDMVMPGMNGHATYLRLRAIDPSVRVLLMSGQMLDGAAQDLLDLGVQAFLVKPYSVATLSSALAKLRPG